ncbi:MAG: 2Fe-2S iron-sulfur cluster binding domain-containing protein [Gammaproteobacteria bacterium]|nr:2Fe-2S iron-sulfur cluster binding domain-containing protein [Gammaproteobacteria bacterium]
MIHRTVIGGIAAALVLIALSAGALTPEEHASHHPGGGAAAAVPGVPISAATAAPGAAGGGMGEMMGKMMAPSAAGGCMGGGCGSGAAKTPIYPSLMTLPALTPEKRAEIDALAGVQTADGMARLAKGAESLDRATQAEDHAAMQQAVGLMREGLDELGAGIAARRVLSEGKAPRNLALDWFKREMNLASPIARDESHARVGVTSFHLFTMGLLIAFALSMVVMYFFKMRRTAALFGRIEPDSGAPPPGASPPLAGGSGPSAPPTAGPTSAAAKPSGDAAEIAGRADALWQARGRPMGSPEIDWSRAEAELTKAADTSPAPPAAGGSQATPATPPAVSEATSAPPLTANWRGQLRIGNVITETPGVKTFRLLPSSSESLIPFTFMPGQFLNVAFGIGGARMNRSYSISSSPTQRDHVDLTVRREPRGAVSRHINDLLKVGDRIEAGGPVGRFTFAGTEADSIVLIAGGVGITPMMSITRYLTERSWAGDIFFIYTCRAPADFIFAEEVAALQRRNPHLHVAVTISKAEGTDWKGARGRISKELLMQTVPDLASRRIHLCGPPTMMDSIRALLTDLGVAAEQVKTEAFGATKPAPAAAGTTAKPTVPATGPLVTFSKNHKSAKIHVDQTVLELSEELAIGIEFSCRVGTCGICKVKMTSGEVEMTVEDALDADDKTNGIILACQAKPKNDIAVEA